MLLFQSRQDLRDRLATGLADHIGYEEDAERLAQIMSQ
jgi:hypothetical protein